MGDFITECKSKVLHVQELLEVNKEWVPRYEKYADKIITNILEIKNLKNRFHEWAPLFLYMNVTQAKSQMEFSLRYLGQDVAKLKASKDRITTSTKGFNEKNKKYFGCIVELENNEWDSVAATNFRNHFSKNPKRIDDLSKKNEEHRIESMLLTQFAKKSSKDKVLCNI